MRDTFNRTKPIVKVRNSGDADLHVSDVEVDGQDVVYMIDSVLLEPTKTKNIYVEQTYPEGQRIEIFVDTSEGVSDTKTAKVPTSVEPGDISVEDITFSMVKLEVLYAEFVSVEKTLREIGDYYKSIGDLQKAKEYYAVADKVLEAMGMIDDLKILVNENIDNLEDIGNEFYQGIEDLKEKVDDIIGQIGVLKASM